MSAVEAGERKPAENYPVRLFSCDTHIEHYPTAMMDYVDEKFHDVLKNKIVEYAQPLWGVGPKLFGPESIHLASFAGHGRFTEISPGSHNVQTDKIPGAYGTAKDYVGWLDLDGVETAVILPGGGLGMALGIVGATFGHDDRLEFLRGYNNFVSDFCSEYPDRLLGGMVVPMSGVDEALAELHRAAKLPGMVTLSPAAFPNGSKHPLPEDDRFYAECMDLGVPITLHGGLSSPTAGLETMQDVATWIIGHVEVTTGGPFTATQLILSGVFDRLPDLRFIILECGAGWLPFMMGEMDHFWDRHRHWSGLRLKNPPSWYCTSGNLLWNIISDRAAIDFRDRIGVGNLSWSSDFPHSNSEFPRSQVRALQLCAGIPAKERYDILWGNAARFYGIEGR